MKRKGSIGVHAAGLLGSYRHTSPMPQLTFNRADSDSLDKIPLGGEKEDKNG